MKKCGFYDETVFLYNEEVIIGKKFKDYGYKSILCMDEKYEHYHSVTMKKNFKSSVRHKNTVLLSHEIFLRKYCNANKFIICFFRYFIRPIAYIECITWPKIKRILKR